MTDREKILSAARLCECDVNETDRSLFFGERRFFFDKDDVLVKIFDYHQGLIYENDICRPLKVANHANENKAPG